MSKHSKVLWDVALTAAGCLGILASSLVKYCAGRGFHFAGSIFSGLLPFLASLSVLLALVFRLFLREARASRLLCIAIYVILACYFHSPTLWFARGFLATVQDRVDPDQLQQWSVSQIAHYDRTNGNVSIPAKELPEYVSRLWGHYPPDVWLSEDEGHRYLALVWGGGFGHWGLYVGAPDLVLTEEGRYPLLQWKPGIYVQSPKP